VRESSIASMREHKEITLAIRNGDAEKVEHLMEDHLGRIGDSLLRRLLPGAHIGL
jgi:DNA-binding GntR family transcriptional regulator